MRGQGKRGLEWEDLLDVPDDEKLPSPIETTDDGEPRHCECPAAGSYVGPPLSDEFYAEEQLPVQLGGAAATFKFARKAKQLRRARRRWTREREQR